MKVITAIAVVLCSTVIVSAQDKTIDKKFLLVNGFLIGSTIFDTETTFAALDNCPNCKEGNPMMRPFIKSGRAATYAFQGAIDAGIIYWSYRLKKEHRKIWWVLPVVMGVSHAVAGGFNLRFVF